MRNFHHYVPFRTHTENFTNFTVLVIIIIMIIIIIIIIIIIMIMIMILIMIIIIIYIEETFSQTWFSKRNSEIKIKTNKCKRTKNMKFIKHLN